MIKRYNQFVKGVNENIDESSFEETEGKLAAQDLEDENDYKDLSMYNPYYDDKDSVEEEEEEAGDIFQNKLQELASLLGEEVEDGKVIHNGKEIIFPSETEMYHVEKKKFKTAEEVVNYLSMGQKNESKRHNKG